VEADFRRVGTRRHKVCAAERRQEVIKRRLVGQVDHRKAQTPLEAVAMKQIVVTGADIEQVARRDAWRIVIVIFRSGSREVDARRSVQRRIAARQWRRERRNLAAAEQPCLNLLVCGNAGQVHRNSSVRHRHGASDQSVVIPPVEGNPWPILFRLILQVCCLLELLVVIDAECAFRREVRAQPAHLRIEEAGVYPAHYHERCQAVKVRNARANGKPADFGPVPGDRERDGSIEKHAEVESIVRVFPQVIAVNDQVPPESLLEPGVKLIALPRTNGARLAQDAGKDAGRISETSNHQVFVKWSLHDPSVGHAKNGVGGFDVVSDAQPRLYLVVVAFDPAINVAAQAHVERPVARRDGVLNIQPHFLDVSVPAKPKKSAATSESGRSQRATHPSHNLPPPLVLI